MEFYVFLLLGMLKTQCMHEMGMIMMDIDCVLNSLVEEDQVVSEAAIVEVVVEVEIEVGEVEVLQQGDLNTEFLSQVRIYKIALVLNLLEYLVNNLIFSHFPSFTCLSIMISSIFGESFHFPYFVLFNLVNLN